MGMKQNEGSALAGGFGGIYMRARACKTCATGLRHVSLELVVHGWVVG